MTLTEQRPNLAYIHATQAVRAADALVRDRTRSAATLPESEQRRLARAALAEAEAALRRAREGI